MIIIKGCKYALFKVGTLVRRSVFAAASFSADAKIYI
jgi:hypothetical protein